MSRPRVLVSDALSNAAVSIFTNRGIDVDFRPDLGKDKAALADVISRYDGLAVRSTTKVTAKLLETADRLKVIGPRRLGHRQHRPARGDGQGRRGDEHAVR